MWVLQGVALQDITFGILAYTVYMCIHKLYPVVLGMGTAHQLLATIGYLPTELQNMHMMSSTTRSV